jgi:hypothetical protein
VKADAPTQRIGFGDRDAVSPAVEAAAAGIVRRRWSWSATGAFAIWRPGAWQRQLPGAQNTVIDGGSKRSP